MILAVALAGTTLVLSYLTAVSAESPGCAGRDILLGYRRGFWDFFTFPLFSVFCLAPIAMSRRSQQIADVLKNYDAPVFEFASLRLTFGMLVIYSSLFGFVLIIGLVTADSATRYRTISKYCYSLTAF
jgi:hypothetical protein